MELISRETNQSAGLPVNFTRLPALRLYADKNRLSSGESLKLRVAILGEGQVTWQADAGLIRPDGTYTAPAVTADTVVRVSACAAAVRCRTVLLEVSPIRIEPAAVPAGGSVQLSAYAGDHVVSSAIWKLVAGPGAISPAGRYEAPKESAGGTAVVSVTFGGYTDTAEIAVRGAQPGLLARIADYR